MSTGPSGADPTVVLAAYWNESERRLYPVATTNPDSYKSAVRLVRAVADALATASDLHDLAERWENRSETLDEAVRVTGDVAGYRLGDSEVAGAGFAMRRRELLAEQAERRRQERIAAARSEGRAWAVVHEQGDLASGLVNPLPVRGAAPGYRAGGRRHGRARSLHYGPHLCGDGHGDGR